MWKSGMGIPRRIGWKIQAAARQKVSVRMPREGLQISSVELAPDGERGIFSAYGEGDAGGATSARGFSAKDGTLLFRSIALMRMGGLQRRWKTGSPSTTGVTIWNLRRDEKGRVTFEGTDACCLVGRMELQSWGSNGGRLATRSADGGVIVWDAVNGKPLHWLNRSASWDLALPIERQDLIPLPCKPALSADNRRLATPYERSFVIWDVETGSRLRTRSSARMKYRASPSPKRASGPSSR